MIRIDGHDKIKGDIIINGEVFGHCVEAVNWEGSYEFTFLCKPELGGMTKIHLIKTPTEEGRLKIKVDGDYVEHTLTYGSLLRGSESFRYDLFTLITKYFKNKL